MENNILFHNNSYSALKKAIDLMCDAVKVTLGPKGKNVLIINNYGDAHLTKDGITVAKNVTSEDPIINGILNVIREASANTAKNVGDGTTSTLVLLQAIFNEGLKLIQEDNNPTLVKQGMQEALEEILKYIDSTSEIITIEDTKRLQHIATISANNDIEVGDIALNAILESKGTGVIKIDDSRTSDTYIKCDTGLTFDKGYISSHFLPSEKTTIEYDNPFIFVSSIELNNKNLIELMKYAKDNSRPLVVLAPEFNENIFMSMFKNFKSGAVEVCPIRLPGFAGSRQCWNEDITSYISGEIYTSNSVNPIKFLGESDRIIISAEETSIINTTPTLSCNTQVCKMQSRLQDDIDDTEKEVLTQRVARLQGRVVTIFVGATTELELKEKKDRIEDAVCALQTALKGGISEGGGMVFLRAGNDLFNNSTAICPIIAGYNAIMNALWCPFDQLCKNSDLEFDEMFKSWENYNSLGFNFKTSKWENLKNSGVIDPTLVLKNVITNAIGIASTLLTTECITYKPN